MTFDELPLYEAIHDVRKELPNPGSDQTWVVNDQQRLIGEILRRLMPPVPWSASEIVNAWMGYRKAADGKADLTIHVARAHGRRCFYANRGLGNCGTTVSLDRLVPGVRGGEYTVSNCVIACSIHNSSRRDTSLEEYLSHGRRLDQSREGDG